MIKGNKLTNIFNINNMNMNTNTAIHNYVHSVYEQLENINFIRGDGPKNETQKDSFKHERLIIEFFENLEFLESIQSLKKSTSP